MRITRNALRIVGMLTSAAVLIVVLVVAYLSGSDITIEGALSAIGVFIAGFRLEGQGILAEHQRQRLLSLVQHQAHPVDGFSQQRSIATHTVRQGLGNHPFVVRELAINQGGGEDQTVFHRRLNLARADLYGAGAFLFQ
jgi:hypothetical protein